MIRHGDVLRFDCAVDAERERGLAEAVAAIRRGQLVVLPTDTVYGVAADPANATAVTALLAAKGRGRHMPAPVLLDRVDQLDEVAASVPPAVVKLAQAFWPGGLTVIVSLRPGLDWDLGDRHATVALRVPDDPLARALLSAAGPLAVSSANLTGQMPAHTAGEAARQLGRSVAVYLDGGARTGGVASSIVDCTTAVPRLVRSGAIPVDRLREVVPDLVEPSQVRRE